MTALDIFLYSASACALIVTVEIIVKACRVAAKPTPAPESELMKLVSEERMNQALPLLQTAMDAMCGKLPIDVTRSQIILYYNDGCKLVLDCEQERTRVEP